MDEVTQINILKAHCFGELSATDYLVPYKNMHEILNERLEEKGNKPYLVFYDNKSKKQLAVNEKKRIIDLRRRGYFITDISDIYQISESNIKNTSYRKTIK